MILSIKFLTPSLFLFSLKTCTRCNHVFWKIPNFILFIPLCCMFVNILGLYCIFFLLFFGLQGHSCFFANCLFGSVLRLCSTYNNEKRGFQSCFLFVKNNFCCYLMFLIGKIIVLHRNFNIFYFNFNFQKSSHMIYR